MEAEGEGAGVLLRGQMGTAVRASRLRFRSMLTAAAPGEGRGGVGAGCSIEACRLVVGSVGVGTAADLLPLLLWLLV